MKKKDIVKEFYKRLENVGVVCGGLHNTGNFKGGCGKEVNILKVYACVDCSAPFHRKCLLKHFKEDMLEQSLTKMSLEDAYKKIDEIEKATS
jgi:hypothetical protein